MDMENNYDTTPNQKKPFIAKYGWIVGVLLILATIILQVVFWQVIPIFIDLYDSFGTDNSVTTYYIIVSVIMGLAEIILITSTICLFFVDNVKFQRFVKWFFIVYAIALPVIFVGTIAILYAPIYQMGQVVS